MPRWTPIAHCCILIAQSYPPPAQTTQHGLTVCMQHSVGVVVIKWPKTGIFLLTSPQAAWSLVGLFSLYQLFRCHNSKETQLVVWGREMGRGTLQVLMPTRISSIPPPPAQPFLIPTMIHPSTVLPTAGGIGLLGCLAITKRQGCDVLCHALVVPYSTYRIGS